jgi:hypothetical protein
LIRLTQFKQKEFQFNSPKKLCDAFCKCGPLFSCAEVNAMEEHAGPRFQVINEGFICAYCGTTVEPLANGSCRNHCPECLASLHLDIHPGDRAANCGGIMLPIRAEVHPRKGIILTHQCTQCHTIKRNRAALDDPRQPDRLERVLALFAGPSARR